MKKNKWVPLLGIAALLSVNGAYGIGGAANGRAVRQTDGYR